MTLLSSHINGKTLEKIENSDDYWHFSFGDDTFLSVFNPMDIMPIEKASDLSSMRGLVVQDVSEADTEVTIQMSGGVAFRIDISPEANVGPEAMLLCAPKNVMVVW
jgi:hypothetical protein